jgi:hypothetical protein
MNKLILFFGIVMISFYSFAQSFPFKIQKSDALKAGTHKSSIILAEKQNIDDLLIVRSYNNNGAGLNEGFYIEHYDSDLKLKKEFNFELNHSNFKKFTVVIGVFTLKNDIIIVSTYYDLNKKSFVCEANTINEDFKISTKELFSITKEETNTLGAFSLQEKFYNTTNSAWTNDNTGDINSEVENKQTNNNTKSDIVLSVNQSKTAFTIALDFNNKKKDDLKLYLFDNNLNKKYETVLSRAIDDDKYVFQNINVSDDGLSIYVVAKNYVDELKNKETGGKYDFEITKITQSTQQFQKITTNLHYLDDLKIRSQNDKLIVIGFYSDVDDFKNTGIVLPFSDPNAITYTGICFFSFDIKSTEMSLENSTFSPFTNQFINDKFGSEKQHKFYKLKIKNVCFSEENNIYLNAEEEIVTYSSGGVGIGVGTKKNTNTFYGDIACIKLDSIGNLVWARNINKEQYDSNEDSFYLSYCSIFKEKNSYLFLNAGEEIKKLDNNRIEFKDSNKNKSNLYLIKIKDNGEFEFEKVLDNEENEVPFMVSKGIQLDNSVFFLGKKGGSKQLLKVTL